MAGGQEEGVREALRALGLRATAPRVAVLKVLSRAERPLSHTEVLSELGKTPWDPATVYRNLVKLRDAGIAPVVSRVDGIDRYALAASGHDEGERHAHFLCDDCGRVECLPAEVTASLDLRGRWADSVRSASVQLRGACPECRASL